VEVLRKKQREDETQFTTKVDGFLSFIPSWMLMYFCAGILIISPCVWPNSGFWWCCVFRTLQRSLMLQNKANNGRAFSGLPDLTAVQIPPAHFW
jgi:hypothetical protein